VKNILIISVNGAGDAYISLPDLEVLKRNFGQFYKLANSTSNLFLIIILIIAGNVKIQNRFA